MAITLKDAYEHCKKQVEICHEDSIRHQEHKMFMELIEKEMPLEPKIKKVKHLKLENDEVFYIDVKICPRCGCDVADHGFGFVCTNPSCRQAIKMKTAKEEYNENIMKRFTEVK